MMEQEDNTRASKRRTAPSKSQITQQISAGLGKVPPQAVDLEEAVLGALMLERNALTAVIDVLHPECFYKDAHSKIFRVIHELFHKAEPIDILTVTHALKKSGELEIVGGPYYITSLTNRVASAANIEYHARIILQKYIQRELIRISNDTIKEAYEETSDVLNLLDNAEKNLFAIAEGNIRRNYEDMHALISKAIKEIEIASKQEGGVTGVPSGFTELDRVSAGWQKSDLIIIAARPGMGKTAFTLSLARNAAVQFKRPVAFFSLEMSSVQLVNRLISAETEITSEALRRGQLAHHEWEQLNAKIVPLTSAPLYIDDTPALSIFELRAKCRRLVAEKKVEMIIIDYLQLMTAGNDSGNREQEISTISRSLKAIAKELEVPIICLSQLSREVEKRGGTKKPQLSDLRESGAIEQDADMVMFIYRPEYYGLTENEEGGDTRGQAEIIVAKNRQGSLKSVNLKFIGQFTKFTDIDSFEFVDDHNVSIGYGNPNVDIERKTLGSRMNDLPDDEPF
ncbi:MAG TPA: replicative DNA helicase [Bacteroidia bacterium]|nr:replicative DNA helicase [Bacteroidia bacterium]HNU34257.1 replicative DNA helicase [Bacteroidia bacterium]